MEYFKKLILDRLLILKPEMKQKNIYTTNPELAKEYNELLLALNNFDLLQIVINATSEAHQKGYGDGFNDGANDMCSRM